MDSSSSRLRPYADTSNAVKVTFHKGEKVEAIWRTDGQRYPGTIVHVYPNDNYEVLFNDGVKSRKKANQIFKVKRRPGRFLPKNLPPIQVPVVTSKPLPGLIPVKTVLGNPPSGAIVPSHLNSSNSNAKTDSQSSTKASSNSPLPTPLSLEDEEKSSTELISTKKDPINTKIISSKTILMPDDPGGSPGPVIPTSSSDVVSSAGLCTKKGFVYVQQPHYSVFDIPPTDLGKRRRRVHNYSRLAKGPPLKGGLDCDIDGLVDGDSNSQPTSPASSVSAGRCSPVEAVVGAPMSNRRKRSSTALTNNISNSVKIKKVIPNRTANSRTEEKHNSSVVTESNSSAAQEVSSSSSNRHPYGKSVCDTDKSVRSTVVESQSKAISVDVKTTNVNNMEAIVNVKPEQQEADSGIPTKRLRKPSSRFSADEGYMDIFSSRRNNRKTLSPRQPRNPAPVSNSTQPTSEITPKLQVQRPKHLFLPASKKKELGPPVLFPETGQVNLAAESLNLKQAEVNNCDQSKTIAQNTGAFPVGKGDLFINDSKHPGSSEEEELLDVGEYTVIEKLPKKKSPRVTLSGSKLTSTPQPSVVIFPSNSKISSKKDLMLHTNKVREDLPQSPSSAASFEKNHILKRRGRGRRWTMPAKTEKSPPEKLPPMPSVLLNRLPIPEIHIMVKKCDSVHLTASATSFTCLPDKATVEGQTILSIKDNATESRQSASSEHLSSSALTSSTAGNWRRKKRWGEGKHRWTKPRHKVGGVLPGIRPIRLKDSLSMQLIKRSRLQRRFEKRGRPKVALLTGITKKKLRKILESIKKRKLKKSRINAYTKFKDVRVDIINCICGRTDEFGLMIQCEVCLCWQHGGCFHIQDSSKLPKFYVCQSCRSPKCVRSSRTTEAVRQEAYKKGVLPFYPFAPKPSIRKQNIIKACDELTKVINSIDDSIRQNKIKEQIALAEPDHPKLYQWSTQRPVPKDQIQRWHFNKYFKSILRRLMSRYKKNPAYLIKLKNIVNFRDKLKKYSQAFEEARLAIRRKIGPRGLILIEKLSEQQCKIEKITNAKMYSNPRLKKQPVQLEKPLVIEQLHPPSLPPPSGRESEEKVIERKNIGASKGQTAAALTEKLERLSERYKYLCDGNSSVDSDDSDFEDLESDSDSDEQDMESKINSTTEDGPFSFVENLSSCAAPSSEIEYILKPSSEVIKHKNAEDNKSLTIDADVGLTNGLVKQEMSMDSSREYIPDDFESEGELATIYDSADGEEYLLQPQTEINRKYNKYRSFLLTDELEKENDEADVLWAPSKSDIVRKDWLWDFDSELDVDEIIGLELEENSPVSEWEQDESTDSSSDEFEVDGDDCEKTTEAQNGNDCLNSWMEKIKSIEGNENSEEESDEDWQVQEALEEWSSSETDNESTEDDSDVKDLPNVTPMGNENSPSKGSETIAKGGIILLTNDPDTAIGDVVEVVMKVGAHDETIGSGKVIAGGKGQNFIRLITSASATEVFDSSNQLSNNSSYKVKNNPQLQSGQSKNLHHSRIPLCKSCRESIGSKWTWDELDSAKGIEVVCEDSIFSFIQELKKYYTLGLWSAKSNIEIDLNKPCGSLPKLCDHQSELVESVFQPSQLKDICKEVIKTSKIRAGKKNILIQDGVTVSKKSSRVNPPTSAEEESILSLLSLSKTPVQFNGENVSELSIESLRRLTDQLQCTNGPLSEGLAKAVGQPLVNGKVNLQNAVQNTKPQSGAKNTQVGRETICVRCSLKGKSSKTLTVLSTVDSELANTISNDELLELHKELSEAVSKVRASAHVIKRAVFKKVSVMVERMKAERIARAKGEKILPISEQGKLALTRPEEYLHGLKTEYVDALLPYATYFISRFTKRDELNKAKKTWVQDMIDKFIIVKKSIKEMYGTDNDESRIGKEDKFYTALDNLRKSFDIVLTKKDIKMRRQNHNSEAANNLGPNGVKVDTKKAMENSKSAVPTILVNGDMPEEVEVACVPDISMNIDVEPVSSENPVPSCGMDKLESENSQLSELELLARLATYPIQVEDVNALLGITSKEIEKTNQSCDPVGKNCNAAVGKCIESVIKVSDNPPLEVSHLEKTQGVKPEQDVHLSNGQEEIMEVDVTNDMKLLEENLELKTSDNLVIGGDMDLINAIGTFSETGEFKGTEDSDLLLNVFEDPVFSEPQEEPKPCCSKSLTSTAPPPPKPMAPVLTKLTPEMCRGYLVEDIRAHQHIIDVQLDRVESEIMELERRRGKGLKEKEDDKLFSRLYSNMQMLIYNMDVLDRVTYQSVGEDDHDNDGDSGSEDGEGDNDDQPEDEKMDEGGSSTESCPSDQEEVEQVDVDIETSSDDSDDYFEEAI